MTGGEVGRDDGLAARADGIDSNDCTRPSSPSDAITSSNVAPGSIWARIIMWASAPSFVITNE
jgi:hypothetical protein